MTDLSAALSTLRAKAPLVHNITNYVVMNNTANALLAIGASPAMVHAPEEAGEFASIASALVINIGTLSAEWVEGMLGAANGARNAGKPWILDPVAVGATAFRRETCARLLALKPDVIRGNASEILALAGAATAGKGVDSTETSDDAADAARRLAEATGSIVAVTGATDYVTDGTRTTAIRNGHPLLTRVTGTGCTATALIGAYLGAGLSPFDAAVAGLVTIGVAAEIAAEDAAGPGAFQLALYDALYNLDVEALTRGARTA